MKVFFSYFLNLPQNQKRRPGQKTRLQTKDNYLQNQKYFLRLSKKIGGFLKNPNQIQN